MEIQGHRGSRGTLPENTLPGFAAAIEAGVDRLELDLLLTKDEEIVIYHDFSINRELCTGPTVFPSLLVKSLTLSEIKQFDCGSRVNPSFPKQTPCQGLRIPTLSELLQMLTESSDPKYKTVGLNLEIKAHPLKRELTADPAIIVKKLFEIIREWNFQERVYYSSFDPDMLLEVKKLNPGAAVAVIYSSRATDKEVQKSIEMAMDLKAEMISPEHVLITDKAYVDHFHQMGFKVMTWTVNRISRFDALIEMGVDGIITDYPEDFMEHFKKNAE